MADFTYDPNTEVGRVRRFLGDTRAETAYFDDSEIQASLDTQGSVEGAVWECASQLAADSTKTAISRSDGDQRHTRSMDNTKRPEFWLKIASRFEKFAIQSTPKARVIVGTTPSDGVPITSLQGLTQRRRG